MKEETEDEFVICKKCKMWLTKWNSELNCYETQIKHECRPDIPTEAGFVLERGNDDKKLPFLVSEELHVVRGLGVTGYDAAIDWNLRRRIWQFEMHPPEVREKIVNRAKLLAATLGIEVQFI